MYRDRISDNKVLHTALLLLEISNYRSLTLGIRLGVVREGEVGWKMELKNHHLKSTGFWYLQENYTFLKAYTTKKQLWVYFFSRRFRKGYTFTQSQFRGGVVFISEVAHVNPTHTLLVKRTIYQIKSYSYRHQSHKLCTLPLIVLMDQSFFKYVPLYCFSRTILFFISSRKKWWPLPTITAWLG